MFGAGILGSGFLLDASGDDAYSVASPGMVVATGSAHIGSGFLVDGGGNDSYRALLGAGGITTGSGSLGDGFLIDLSGNDVYDSRSASAGAFQGSGGIGSGTLIDLAGDDTYYGSAKGGAAINGGAQVGRGLLLDPAGDNRFEGHATIHPVLGVAFPAVNGAGHGVRLVAVGVTDLMPGLAAGVPIVGLGVLLAGPGDDAYFTEGSGQGAGTRYTAGLLVDVGGANTYVANGTGIAQGAGAAGGVGILHDAGRQTDLMLLENVVGQGTGLQGVGILRRTDPVGVTTYAAEGGAIPSKVSGAGMGLRIDTGVFTLLGTLPDIECQPGREVHAHDDGGRRFRACGPEDAEPHGVINPSTGAPLGNAPKPGVGCGGLGPCEETTGALLGDRAVDWLDRGHVTTTTRGGFLQLAGRDAATGAAVHWQQVTVASFDDSCELGCARAFGGIEE